MRWLLAALAAIMIFAIAGLMISISSDDPFIGMFGVGATTIIFSRLLRLLVFAFIVFIVFMVAKKLGEAARPNAAGNGDTEVDPLAQATVDVVRKGYDMYRSLSPDQKAEVNKVLTRGFWTVIGATRNKKASRKILELREMYNKERQRTE